jgi:riboflavin kinase/FMN adenylyltransferase
VWLLRFGPRLRNLTGQEFASLLARELASPLVVVGHDFRFGRGGEANVPLLTAEGAKLGFTVDIVPPVTMEGERVSSSGVREALSRGDFPKAARCLGRPYAMTGRVVHGNQLGRTLGFPTANLRIERRRSPLSGIFAVRVHGVAGRPLPGVASLGIRPTVAGKEMLLEAHVFDYSGDLYGREIQVELVAKLREEQKFDTLDALVAQMHQDAAAARSILDLP